MERILMIGGVFIALALLWGVLVDRFMPAWWDLMGAAICGVLRSPIAGYSRFSLQ